MLDVCCLLICCCLPLRPRRNPRLGVPLLGSKLTHRFSIYDDDDSKKLLAKIVKQHAGVSGVGMTAAANEVMGLISHIKSRLPTVYGLTAQESLDKLGGDPRVQNLYKPYNQKKLSNLIYTFDE